MADDRGAVRAAVAAAVAAVVGGAILVKLADARGRAREAEERAAADAARRSELALELMSVRNKFMHTEGSIAAGRAPAFQPRADDVFVVTYPKCGTTWMTQICHVLRTRADPALNTFGEITEVVPWDVLAKDCGQDLNADHVASPRVFKSHEAVGTIAKGAKYIYVARDPSDAFYSFYKFLPPYMGLQDGDITMEDFSQAIFANVSHSGQIWHHYLGWWERRNDPNVLWVFFEDLKTDFDAQVRRVAAFMNIDLDDLLFAKVREMASFDYMQRHGSQFDDHFVFDATKAAMGRDENAKFTVGKVRKGGGKVGTRKTIPASVRHTLDSRWYEVINQATGCVTYEAFRASVDR